MLEVSIYTVEMTVFRYGTKGVAVKTNHLQFLDSLLIGSVIFLL